LPSKFLHIWQARNISLQLDKKKTCGFFFWFLLFVTFVFCVTKSVDHDLNQLKIPTASSKNFPSRKKTYIAHHKTICNPISPFIGTPIMACAQTQSIKKRKRKKSRKT